MKKKVTIMDVARDCGLSKSTVAYALNSSAKGKVSLLKREIVKRSAVKLGYRPNIMAQSLRSGRTNSIGLLWSLAGPHDSIGVVRNISIRLMRKGYACHMADSLSDPKIIKQCLKDFCCRNVDGVIIQLEKELVNDKEIYNLLREISNVVIVMPEPVDSEFDSLILDRTHATREIVNHFAASGRKKITFMTGASSIREPAFIEQIKACNLACYDDSIIHLKERRNENDKEQGLGDIFLYTIQNTLDKKIPFDALLVSCDEGAVAIINYLEKNGYKVPEDIAVSGFNNSAVAPHLRIPLASVDRRNQDVAESVTKMLLNRIKNSNLPLQRELLEMKFIHRESAG